MITDAEWNSFIGLPGSCDTNFEAVCRAAISRTYGGHGILRGLINQPGVEFHLQLQKTCDLGNAGRWWGWQCRWYDLPRGRAIGTNRKKKIEEAIRKSETELSGLTDWVLWTRHPLTKGDQKWYFSLPSSFDLHLWTGEDLGSRLVGGLSTLKQAYFGTLILTPDALEKEFRKSEARVRGRWIPEVHQTDQVEELLEKHLLFPSSWPELGELRQELESLESELEGNLKVAEGEKLKTQPILIEVRGVKHLAFKSQDALNSGNLEFFLADFPLPALSPRDAEHTLRMARRIKSPLALMITNSISAIRRTFLTLKELKRVISMPLVAVKAEAGNGKTHLAISLTAEKRGRPNGLLLHGKDLGPRGNWQQLTQGLSFSAASGLDIDSLLAALDAAGRRAGCRLPLVIDGLNEAEDPRRWKELLSPLFVQAEEFPHVLTICTVRPAFARDALPEKTPSVELAGFGDLTPDAIKKYFEHYRIVPKEARPPSWLLSHPLTLRIYCEVANGQRVKEVGLEGLPQSLSALLERYLEQSAQRISELSSTNPRIYPDDVLDALHVFGQELWNTKSARLDQKYFRAKIDDSGSWANSLARALEQEGLLIKEPGSANRSIGFSATFDALGGYLVARAMTRDITLSEFEASLKQEETESALFGPITEQFRLARDTVEALGEIMPRRYAGKHLWSLLNGESRSNALATAARLEAEHIDDSTLSELKKHLDANPQSWFVFDRIQTFRSSRSHPLNACFLDECLTSMSVRTRDLSWSEWLRRNSDRTRNDISHWFEHWRSDPTRTEEDLLIATWFIWCFTSNNRTLRDEATRAVYFYALRDPAAFLELALAKLEVNDPYVLDRLMAVAYGLTLACANDHVKMSNCFAPFAAKVLTALFLDKDSNPITSHILILEYARRLIEVSAKAERVKGFETDFGFNLESIRLVSRVG